MVIPLDSLLFLEDNKVFSRINLVDNVQFKSHDIILMDVLPIAYLNSFLISDSSGISFDLNEDVIPLKRPHFQHYFPLILLHMILVKKNFLKSMIFTSFQMLVEKRIFISVEKNGSKKDDFNDYNSNVELNIRFHITC